MPGADIGLGLRPAGALVERFPGADIGLDLRSGDIGESCAEPLVRKILHRCYDSPSAGKRLARAVNNPSVGRIFLRRYGQPSTSKRLASVAANLGA